MASTWLPPLIWRRTSGPFDGCGCRKPSLVRGCIHAAGCWVAAESVPCTRRWPSIRAPLWAAQPRRPPAGSCLCTKRSNCPRRGRWIPLASNGWIIDLPVTNSPQSAGSAIYSWTRPFFLIQIAARWHSKEMRSKSTHFESIFKFWWPINPSSSLSRRLTYHTSQSPTNWTLKMAM